MYQILQILILIQGVRHQTPDTDFMFWIIVLAVISFLLLFAGSLGILLAVRRYMKRSRGNKVRLLTEMMQAADQVKKDRN